jgi:hypothetical protein
LGWVFLTLIAENTTQPAPSPPIGRLRRGFFSDQRRTQSAKNPRRVQFAFIRGSKRSFGIVGWNRWRQGKRILGKENFIGVGVGIGKSVCGTEGKS